MIRTKAAQLMSFGFCSISVHLVDDKSEIKELLVDSGVSGQVAVATEHDFMSKPSILNGCAFTRAEPPLVLVLSTGDVAFDGLNIIHEVGHCLAYRIGANDKSELVARVLGGTLAQYQYDMVYRWLREVYSQVSPKKGKVPLTADLDRLDPSSTDGGPSGSLGGSI